MPHPLIPSHFLSSSSSLDPGEQSSSLSALLPRRGLSDLSGTSVHPDTHNAIILAGITVGIIAGLAFTTFCIHKVVEYCQDKRKRDVEAQEAGCTPKIGELKCSSGLSTVEHPTLVSSVFFPSNEMIGPDNSDTDIRDYFEALSSPSQTV